MSLLNIFRFENDILPTERPLNEALQIYARQWKVFLGSILIGVLASCIALGIQLLINSWGITDLVNKWSSIGVFSLKDIIIIALGSWILLSYLHLKSRLNSVTDTHNNDVITLYKTISEHDEKYQKLFSELKRLEQNIENLHYAANKPSVSPQNAQIDMAQIVSAVYNKGETDTFEETIRQFLLRHRNRRRENDPAKADLIFGTSSKHAWTAVIDGDTFTFVPIDVTKTSTSGDSVGSSKEPHSPEKDLKNLIGYGYYDNKEDY